ncbi:heme oxygenase [Pararhizobium capsulatum DSM 1112]|uniref:Heme oxygenase n=1 Tax=Pararhizobium capsulatum DSM 1112 TaxID=1121113 RepID=A0ABU0BPR4_9HYPH|nr:biliverdin-producing heme oxygenase [Pararhizobium capsulatum]MDQ0318862.1 heme oxygenase [Pararhizobium capsulatum DSM 1112]
MRERTAQAHADVDEAIGALDTMESYRSYLASLYAFRKPIEDRLAETTLPAELGPWRPRMIADAIAGDMTDLGIAVPAATRFPFPLDGDALFGTLYVLEGSSLGARVLYKRAEALGLNESFGARHLALQSGDIEGWRGFLSVLETVEPFDLGSAVAASNKAFATAHDAFLKAV